MQNTDVLIFGSTEGERDNDQEIKRSKSLFSFSSLRDIKPTNHISWSTRNSTILFPFLLSNVRNREVYGECDKLQAIQVLCLATVNHKFCPSVC